MSNEVSQKTSKGSCFCGASTYQISDHLDIFQYCHCSMCRKFTGSAFAANLFVKPAHFEWTQSDHVTNYNPPETKYFATAFCNQCGSSMPWLSKSGRVMILPAGSLDDEVEIKPSQNIYCGSRAHWYQEPNALPQHDEMPPKAV